LACVVGGLLISLRTQTSEWRRIRADLPVSGADGWTDLVQDHGPAVILVGLPGALLVALLMAGLMHLLRGLRPSGDSKRLWQPLAAALEWLEDNQLVRGLLMIGLAVIGIIGVFNVGGRIDA
jgi:hypothetical protein